ncbi:rCG48276, isoform CRA_a [Rattus norvegicus]|uniref:RCG48276, isoform CRA_a n=1 Tax=Rattus norvegicus TaxID=10116 RepID=A6HZG7_RAT|nr:rCG48276, isoform CRA_a [Rattus norvegicus]EDM12599.1 rCG48276, isoform CRA_a [Rattus norvegicus]
MTPHFGKHSQPSNASSRIDPHKHRVALTQELFIAVWFVILK